MPILGRFVRIDKARRKARVSRIVSKPTQKRIEAMNQAMERSVRASLEGGILMFRRDVAKIEMDRAFRDRNYNDVMQIIPWDNLGKAVRPAADALTRIIPRTKEQVAAGIVGGTTGNAAHDPLFTRPLNFGGGVTGRVVPGPAESSRRALRMDTLRPNIENHMAARKARYLQDLIAPKHEQAFAIIERARAARTPPHSLARQLADVVGLNPQQQKAIDNQRSKMLQDPNNTPEQIDDKISRQSERYLKQRCKMIAVTETRAASGMAQLETWLAMQDQGIIPEGCRKQWIIGAEDACPKICEPIDGQIRDLRDDFTLGNGKPCRMGGLAHPMCRCGTILLWPEGEDDDSGRNEAAFPTVDEISALDDED